MAPQVLGTCGKSGIWRKGFIPEILIALGMAGIEQQLRQHRNNQDHTIRQPFQTSILSCVSEAAGATLGIGELLHLYDFGLLASSDDHLGDALAVVDYEVLL